MKYNISIQKISKLLLMFILTLLITTTCININNTSKVYVSTGNGNQGKDKQKTQDRSGGINTLQQGFLLYVADIDSGDTMTPGNTYSIKIPTVQMR
jgi:hypothetical protein